MKIDELEHLYEFYPFEYEKNLECLQISKLFSFDKFRDEIVISNIK